MKVILLNGPIAGGKSTLGRALVEKLQPLGEQSAFYDLDDEVERLHGSHVFENEQEKRDAWLASRKNCALQVTKDLQDEKVVIVAGPFYQTDEIEGFTDYLPNTVKVLLYTLRVPLEVRLVRNRERKYPNDHWEIERQAQQITALTERFGYVFDNDIKLSDAVDRLIGLIHDNIGQI